jgi:hypothetical protein
MFAENFAAYADGVDPLVAAAGPRVEGLGGEPLALAGPGEG